MADNQILLKSIYLAGGCFWGLEAYFSHLNGIIKTLVGYANGKIKNPTYIDIITTDTDYAETLLIEYNPKITTLKDVLNHFFDIIDPTIKNRQGNDSGTQYRTGIYYVDKNDKEIIKEVVHREQKKYRKPIVTEIKKLENFYPAEQYHQKYLEKNPGGYCHVNLSEFQKYYKPSQSIIKNSLSEKAYEVTQENKTERPYSSPYNDFYKDGIYIDVVSGEPLFSSKDKFHCGCGWPSFSKPIKEKFIKEKDDYSFDMKRTEVRSTFGDSHLGHLFDDGPVELGGKRYCINGAALKFIPKEQLSEKGYDEYKYLFHES